MHKFLKWNEQTSILNVILKDIQNVYIYTNNVKLCTIRMWKPADKTSLGYQYGTVYRNVTGMGLSQNLFFWKTKIVGVFSELIKQSFSKCHIL